MLVAFLRLLWENTRTFISSDFRDVIFSTSNLNTSIFWLIIWLSYRWLAPRTSLWQAPTGEEILALHRRRWMEERSHLGPRPRRRIKLYGLNNLQRILRLPPDLSVIKNHRTDDKRYKGADHPSAPCKPLPHNPATRSPSALFRCGSDLPDAIFIAIDFETDYYELKNSKLLRLREVGISMLDMRALQHGNFDPQKVISDRHYLTVKSCIPFIFGNRTTTMISQPDVIALLKRLLYIDNPARREIRDIILVGQGFKREIRVMKAQGIDILLAPSLVDIFDTEFLAHEVFGNGRGFKVRLCRLARMFGISRGKVTFHNAGNDAGYTLRVMLLLAVCRCDGGGKLDRAQRSRMEMYSKIAKS